MSDEYVTRESSEGNTNGVEDPPNDSTESGDNDTDTADNSNSTDQVPPSDEISSTGQETLPEDGGDHASSAPLPIPQAKIVLNVRAPTNKVIQIRVPPNSRIADVKEAIMYSENMPVNVQILVYGGQILEDAETIEKYGIHDGTIFNLILRLPGS